MKHSHEAVLLVDPVQYDEESLTILGVYGSFAAAKAALPRLRRLPHPQGFYAFRPERESQAQRWRGGECVETWTFNPDEGWCRHEIHTPSVRQEGEQG